MKGDGTGGEGMYDAAGNYIGPDGYGQGGYGGMGAAGYGMGGYGMGGYGGMGAAGYGMGGYGGMGPGGYGMAAYSAMGAGGFGPGGAKNHICLCPHPKPKAVCKCKNPKIDPNAQANKPCSFTNTALSTANAGPQAGGQRRGSWAAGQPSASLPRCTCVPNKVGTQLASGDVNMVLPTGPKMCTCVPQRGVRQ